MKNLSKNLAALCCLILAMTLSACGGGGGGSSGVVPTVGTVENFSDGARMLTEAGVRENSGVSIREEGVIDSDVQTFALGRTVDTVDMASGAAGAVAAALLGAQQAQENEGDISRLTPYDGSDGGLNRSPESAELGEELVFLFEEQNGALIRSGGGSRYLFLHRQDELADATALSDRVVHVLDFDTNSSPAAVNEMVSGLRTVGGGLAAGTALEANLPEVKGAREDRSTWVTGVMDDGTMELEFYNTDAYIFETDYSALALWIEDPEFFYDDAAWGDADAGVIHYGLQTTDERIPDTGGAEYSGLAAGGYLRNGGTASGDRFIVGGRVMLTADFTVADGISGTADLNAYDAAAEGPPAVVGMVTVALSSGTFGTGDERPTFSGDASVMGTPTASEAFADLGSNVNSGSSGFQGFFTGPNAEEAVGGVHLETMPDANGVGADFLEFGFLTRRPSDIGTITEATLISVASQVTVANAPTSPVVPIPQPGASSSDTATDFRDGTDEIRVFPIAALQREGASENAALIRSADGNDYAYIYQQDAFTAGSTQISETVHRAGFLTGSAPESQVVSVVAAFQSDVDTADDNTGLASATLTVDVKGARGEVPFLDTASGDSDPYTADAYIFETEYSAFALWINNPGSFLGTGDDWGGAGEELELFHFGLQTPAAAADARTGIATYSGVATGTYERNINAVTGPGPVAADDRFFVSGGVMLNANFDTTDGISGTAVLNAYNVADLDASAGVVTVQLTNPGAGLSNPLSNIGDIGRVSFPAASFRGGASVDGTPTAGEAFADLGSGVVADESFFVGFFTGPAAEEAVGVVRVGTMPANPGAGGADVLGFGFLTRQEP